MRTSEDEASKPQHQILAEAAVSCVNRMRVLALHEKASVWEMIGSMLRAEAKSLELAQMPRPGVSDEHFRA